MKKIQPTPEQWACLLPKEKFHFRVVDAINRGTLLPPLASLYNAHISRFWVECFVRNHVVEHGFDNFRRIDPNRGVFLVANHRTFYDMFTIMGRLYTLFGNHHRICFPIRSPFFYDTLAGMFVNLTLACGAMYPPIIRDPKRKAWNSFAMEILAEVLQDRRNLVGFHPEGKRSQEPDPYQLLPGQLGTGFVIHKSRANVVPVYLQGFPRSVLPWPVKNLTGRPKPVVHMVMGSPLDLAEELEGPADRRTYLKITKKTMDALAQLAEREKAIRAEWDTGDRVSV